MSWYVIAWRDSSKRRISLEVPGLEQWFRDNMYALDEKKLVPTGVSRVCDITPNDGLNNMFKARNEDFRASGDTLWMDSTEYFHLTDIVPEHQAPTIRFWLEDGWHWHAVDEETGKKEIRTVFAITQCADVVSAINHAKEHDDAYGEQVEKYDTEQWCMDQISFRDSYETWRKHMHEQIGVMPPPHVVDDEPEESEDDATQG